MAEISAPPNKKVKFEPTAVVIPKLPEKKIAILRQALLVLENDIRTGFNLLKITNSNAEMCVPFKNSFLKLERSADLDPPEARRVYNFAGVFLKGVNILKLYLEDPEKVPEGKESRIALQRLAQTISKIEDIGRSLSKMMSPDKKRGTAWSIRVAHHLLKELSVNQQYRIDVNSKFKTRYCSCCNESIEDYGNYDDCTYGNSKVWHGCIHILMGPHPTVAIHAQDSDDAIGADIDGSSSAFEVNDSSDLINDRSQIIAETIVFAFLQKKNNPAFENYLIPAVGISEKDVLFHFYDPIHDILLESPPFNIFGYLSSELYYPTVLALWFTLNYKIFCTGITRGMKERNFTADFLSRVEDDVKTIYNKHLHFRHCGIGSVRSTYFIPKELAGFELDKTEPYKS